MLTLVTSPLSIRRPTADGSPATGGLLPGGVHCGCPRLSDGLADGGLFLFFNIAMPVGVNGFTDSRILSATPAEPPLASVDGGGGGGGGDDGTARRTGVCRARGVVTTTADGVVGDGRPGGTSRTGPPGDRVLDK